MKDIMQQLVEDEVHFINFQFTTIDGAIRQLIHPVRGADRLLVDGIGFDGSSCKYVPVNQSDLTLMPDSSTYQVLPWGTPENRTARLICDVFTSDGARPFPADPRSVLKKTIQAMKDEFGAGWDFVLAPEVEFFLMRKDEHGAWIPDDRASYFEIPPYDQGCEFRKDISRALDSVGIVAEKNHHEVPPGKHEINFKYADALSTADRTMTFRQVVKYLAGQKGLVACFMPKPFAWTYGCGMHVHLNLKDSIRKVNLFYDPDQPHFLSNQAKWFIGGLIEHARGLTGVTNPSINSYKRLVPGWEAPVYVSWGLENRSSLLRIPASNPEAVRVETRNPDSSCNPYMAFTVLLAAGLDGIRKKIEPPAMINDNIYAFSPSEKQERGIGDLPGDLKEALAALAEDKILTQALGEELTRLFLSLKTKEVQEFQTTVHSWELDRYLNV